MTDSGHDWMPRYNSVVQHFHNESDRAAGLLASSFLEATLRHQLQNFLVNDTSTGDLFRAYHPLSEFSALIDMRFSLGLLTRAMKSDLTLIRKIRNHFAHHPEHTTFSVSPVSDFCRELSTAKSPETANSGLLRIPEPRGQFILAVAITITYFERFVRANARRCIPDFPLER